MRCVCCNVPLSAFESTRKNKQTNDYLDMCGECATVLPISSIDADDLMLMELDRGIIDISDNYEE